MSATITRPDAEIYYRTEGTGPVLLLLPGGDGDADTYGRMAAELSARHTVVTFDRRGLSRSTGAPTDSRIADHADDAAAVLAAIGPEPAFVFGSSIGAVVALELTVRHPDAVRAAIVHEPPVTALLPEPARTEFAGAQRDIETAFAEGGIAAATAGFARLIALDPSDREPDVDLVRPGPERAANLTAFLTHDAPAVRHYRPDAAALRDRADKIVPVVGAATTGMVPGCAHALAELLGADVIRFPGGHTAPSLRPRGTAEALGSVIESLALTGG